MAYDLNGSNQAISYTLNADQTSLNTLTIASWLYPDNVGQYRRWFHLGPAFPNGQVSVEFDDGWGMVFVARRTGDPGAWSIPKPSTGAWIHYAATYDNTSTTNDPLIYTNGTSQTVTERSAPTGTPNNNSTALYIGSEANGGQYWDGRIGEVGMWNRILTADEIAALGEGFSPLFFINGLVFYAPFIRGANELRYGLSGTLANSPSVIEHPRIMYPSSGYMQKFTAGAAPAAGSGNDWPTFQSRGFWSWRF